MSSYQPTNCISRLKMKPALTLCDVDCQTTHSAAVYTTLIGSQATWLLFSLTGKWKWKWKYVHFPGQFLHAIITVDLCTWWVCESRSVDCQMCTSSETGLTVHRQHHAYKTHKYCTGLLSDRPHSPPTTPRLQDTQVLHPEVTTSSTTDTDFLQPKLWFSNLQIKL